MSNGLYADMVVYGKAYTAEKDVDVCEAFAIKDGKYIYVGDKDGAKEFIEDGSTKIVDNFGGLIIPGCTEGHAHFVGVDALLKAMPGFNSNYDELLEIIKEGMASEERPVFYITFGMNFIDFMERYDSKKSYAEELEMIAPGIPIILLDNGGHNAICSLESLKRADLLDGKQVRGGSVLLNDDGVVNGIVTDEVVLYVTERALDLSTIDPDIYRNACKNAINTLHKRGFTNYFDAYINYLTGTELYKYLREMDDRGELDINVATAYTLRSYEAQDYREKIDHMIKLGKDYCSKHFDPLNLKLFSDGVVDTKTGWMLEEYPDADPGEEHGNIIWKPQELKDIVYYANSKDIPVHTHTFGDGACKATVDAYEDSLKKTGKVVGNTLAHVRNIRPEDIKRCADNSIIIAENLIWHNDVIPDDENYEKTLSEMKACFQEGVYEHGYPMKSLVENGIVVTSSTDAPAAEAVEGNIMNVIEVSTTGLIPDSNCVPYYTEELLTVRQALDCLTINGAKQLGIDDRCGSIKVGKNADFVMLDTDFLDFQGNDLRTIHNTKIKSLYFEGKEVYNGR